MLQASINKKKGKGKGIMLYGQAESPANRIL